MIYDHVSNCKDIGLSDEKIKANLIGPILISASNTMGISSAFFLRNLPDSAHVNDSEIEMDGSWVAERIITRMPIRL